MRRLLPLVVVLLALSACGEEPTAAPGDPATPTRPEPTPTATQTPDGPDATPAPTETGTAPDDGDDDGEAEATTTAYFVREHDSGFWVEPASTELEEATAGVARAAIEHMVSGDPADPNLVTLAGPGVEVLGVDIDGDVLVVDLSGEIREQATGGAGEEAFAQQLAHTGTQFDGIESVQLLVDGAEITELWGHLSWSEPVTAEPFALSPITFDSHTWGEEVPAGEVTVGGEANTFEATVELRLLGPGGDVVEETFTTATSGSGERGTWEHTFSLEGAGTWTIEAIEPDPSDGEGRPPFTTTLELRSS
jgi:hypothetical protein